MVFQPMTNDIGTIRAFMVRRRRDHALTTMRRRALWLTAIFAFVATAQQVIFALFPWTVLPLTFVLTILGFFVALIAAATHAWVRSPNLVDLARRVEHEAGGAHPLLSIALEIAGTPHRHGSDQLRAEVVRLAAQSLPSYPRRMARARIRLPAGAGCAGLIVLVASGALLQPRLAQYWDFPFVSMRRPRVAVEPGTISVPLKAPVVLRLLPEKRVYPSCNLTVAREAIPQVYLLRPDSAGCFSWTADSLDRSLVYAFGLAGAQFGPDTIRVVSPPRLRELQINLRPPAYTGVTGHDLREGQGSFAAYPGTTARIRVATVQGLADAWLYSATRDTVRFEVDSNRAVGEILVGGAERYTFGFRDFLGQTSDSIPSFQIEEIADVPPMVRILRPGVSKALAPAQVETLWIEAADDIGLRSLALQFRKGASPTDTVSSRPLALPRGVVSSLTKEIVWDLKSLSLYPGDTVYYWVKAGDGRTFPRPQWAASDTFYFRIPGLGEIQEQILTRQDAAQRGLEAVRNRQERLGESLSGLSQRKGDERGPTWEDKELLRDMAQDLRSQADSLARALERFEESIDKMRDEGLSDGAVLEKMEQVRRAIEDLVRQYGDSLLFEPPDPRQAFSWQDVKKSLEQLERALPDMERQLDNTLAYLENLKQDQRLASLAARAERLAREQHQAASAALAAPRKLAVQRDVTSRTGELIEELKAEGDGGANAPAPQLGALPPVESLHRQFSSELGRGALPESSAQRSMSGGLLSLAEELRSMMSGSMAAKLEQDRSTLLRLAHDAMSLAQWQQDAAAPRAPETGSRATAQQAIGDALRKSLRKLDSLELAPPPLVRTLAGRAASATAAVRRNLEAAQLGGSDRAAGESGAALRSLSAAALKAARDLRGEGEQAGSGSEGMSCGLRRLSGKQAAINALTGQMLREMLGRSGKPGQTAPGGEGERLREEARREQGEISRKLKELSQGAGAGESGELKNRVEELSREARELAEMLSDGQLQVQDRQDRFLARMLESALSIHKRDEGGEERKSVSARTIYSPLDAGVRSPALSRPDDYYLLRQRALQGGFPEEYRAAVQTYVDSLGAFLLR